MAHRTTRSTGHLRRATAILALALAACTSEQTADPARAHREATDALFAVVEDTVGALRAVAAGELEAAAACDRLDAARAALDEALSRRRELGPATTPPTLDVYAALEPRREALFTECNELSLRLRSHSALLQRVQALVFPAIEALAAGAE